LCTRPIENHVLWTDTRLTLSGIGFPGVADRARGECVQTATQRFDKENAGGQTPTEDVERGDFVVERCRLSHDDIEVVNHPRFVLFGGYCHGLLCCPHCLVLHLSLILKNP